MQQPTNNTFCGTLKAQFWHAISDLCTILCTNIVNWSALKTFITAAVLKIPISAMNAAKKRKSLSNKRDCCSTTNSLACNFLFIAIWWIENGKQARLKSECLWINIAFCMYFPTKKPGIITSFITEVKIGSHMCELLCCMSLLANRYDHLFG